ncbi:hypothetical protein [Novosphingobium sp.]|uniref:hypothetical protein n=1 Tax=Novosphingobium sp. TaxID=1874826 RepID=UPI0027354459|nr:hypothetical protein [Novosphingobium sp.]MDP3905812.1 hypothetical protein [Novosphingobium sp.]
MSQDPAMARFFIIQAVRAAGVAAAVYGMVALAGKAQIPPPAGLVLTLIGMIVAYLGPITLAKRWKSPDA